MLRKPFGDIASNGLRNCILFSHSTMQEMVVPISLLLDPVPSAPSLAESKSPACARLSLRGRRGTPRCAAAPTAKTKVQFGASLHPKRALQTGVPQPDQFTVPIRLSGTSEVSGRFYLIANATRGRADRN